MVAGRLSRNVIMSGNVFVNGKKRRLDYGGAVSMSLYSKNKNPFLIFQCK